MDEMPDSWEQWYIKTKMLPCPAQDPGCEGHKVAEWLYCPQCIREKKHEAHTDS